ncbi:MAG: glycosyltransferase [Pleurocapsa sp. SU_196_0]|nr:glycosyltransferase [Pleurocapsa sp. SU_196_0]
MHVAIVTTFPPSRGTLCEYGEHLVRAYANHPEVSRVTVIGDVIPSGETLNLSKVAVRRVWRFNDASSAVRIQSALRRVRPDAVVYNLQFASFGDTRVPAALGLLAPMLSRIQGIPTLTLLHNIMETVNLERAGFGAGWKARVTRFMGSVFTHALLRSHIVGTTMPNYVEILERVYGARNVFLSPHGSFGETQVAPLPEVPTVMTFGKFGTYKTVEPLLEAHRIILRTDPSVRLVIAGGDSPNAPGYLERVRAQYATLPNVTFTGYVEEADVPKVFAESTVVAFPYNSTTGSSGVLHQAGQFGRAVVMPNIGDLAALVDTEGYGAEFFEADDAQSLASALLRVLHDSERALNLGVINRTASQDIPLEDVVTNHLGRLRALKREVRPTIRAT